MPATAMQTALYTERWSPATPGVNLPFTPEDLVTQLDKAARLGMDDQTVAAAWGVPVEFVHSFRAARGEL
jgi:hypothetical protein